MEAVSPTTVRMSHRDHLSRLSRRGFVMMLVAMFIVPIGTVLTLWYYLPPVSMYDLEAEVRIENLETAAQFDRRNRSDEIPEPLILVTNLGENEWTHVTVELNSRYKIWRHESTVKPGETLSSGLDYFQTREGLFFPPGRIPITKVRVYARLPSGSRATHEVEYSRPKD